MAMGVRLPEVEPGVAHRLAARRHDEAFEGQARAGELREHDAVAERRGPEVHAADLPWGLRKPVAPRRRRMRRGGSSGGERKRQSEDDEPGAYVRHRGIEATTRFPPPD